MKKTSLMILLVLAAWVFTGCQGASTRVLGTPMPTLIPATPPMLAVSMAVEPEDSPPCRVHAVSLIQAWAEAGAPEDAPFTFIELDGRTCQGTFATDIQPLFTTSNLWYSGAPPCVTCHNEDVVGAWAQLDLSSYAAILAGSRRASAQARGNNILGMTDGGMDWNQSILNLQLTTYRMPPGHPGAGNPLGPVVRAGK